MVSIYYYRDKTFRIDSSGTTNATGYTFAQMDTRPGKTSTGMARTVHDSFGLDSFFAKGANQPVFIGTTNLYKVLFTWTTTTRTMDLESMLEASGVMVFDRAWTLAGNLYRDSAAAAVNRLAGFLRAKGYVPG